MYLKKDARLIWVNPLYLGNPLTGTFANSEVPDDISGTALFVKVKKIFRQKNKIFFFYIIT